MNDSPTLERLRTARGFVAYALHVPLHWLSFALLPWAGDWVYRRERREARASIKMEASDA